MAANPASEDYKDNPAVLEKLTTFNQEYSDMLRVIEESFNGEPKLLGQAVGVMYELKILAKELMEIVAVAGLAQNFAAIKSLTTTGIQQGHMKMHLLNILNQFEATEKEKSILIDYFKTNTVTHSAVVKAIETLRA